MNLQHCMTQMMAKDQARDSLPGEHALVAAAGGALIVSALFAPSPLRATLRAMLGGALLVRAASGRDGVAQWMNTAEPEPEPAAGKPWAFPKSPQAGATRPAPGSTSAAQSNDAPDHKEPKEPSQST